MVYASQTVEREERGIEVGVGVGVEAIDEVLLEDYENVEIDVSEEDVEEITSRVLNFLVFNNTTINSLNASTTESIVSHCFPTRLLYALKRGQQKILFGKVMNRVHTNIQHLFGYELVTDGCMNALEQRKTKSAQQKHGSSRQDYATSNTEEGVQGLFSYAKSLAKDRWFLVNKFRDDEAKLREAERDEPLKNRKKGLLMLILANIVLSGSSTPEKKLATVLSEYGISRKYSTDAPLQGFGASQYFEDFIKEFSSLGYLKRKQSGDERDEMNQPLWEIELGNRTYLEIGLQNLVSFISQTCNVQLTKHEMEVLMKQKKAP